MFITALVFGAGLFVGAIVAVVVYFFLNKNIAMLESDNSALRQELSVRQAEATTLVRETERLRAEANNTAERLAEQRKEITALHEELNKEFRLLANEIWARIYTCLGTAPQLTTPSTTNFLFIR